MVAPRQPSFMFSKTLNFNSAGSNFDYWISLYSGGLLFDIILYNQVNNLFNLFFNLMFLIQGKHIYDTCSKFCS
jgi:hypothetical protein